MGARSSARRRVLCRLSAGEGRGGGGSRGAASVSWACMAGRDLATRADGSAHGRAWRRRRRVPGRQSASDSQDLRGRTRRPDSAFSNHTRSGRRRGQGAGISGATRWPGCLRRSGSSSCWPWGCGRSSRRSGPRAVRHRRLAARLPRRRSHQPTFADAARQVRQRLPEVAAPLQQPLAELGAALFTADRALAGAQGFLARVDHKQLTRRLTCNAR